MWSVKTVTYKCRNVNVSRKTARTLTYIEKLNINVNVCICKNVNVSVQKQNVNVYVKVNTDVNVYIWWSVKTVLYKCRNDNASVKK